ncbi:hypothetical protein [Azonexus hydrophilus]|uniref:Uncharacterized protein n=1 Tax=Azonexus hydrophilus TaxID=418702 RepID=A0ABZ2XLU3_9RHOO
MSNALKAEIESRVRSGMICVPMEVLEDNAHALGYRFDRELDCKSIARYMAGERAGATYPANNLYPVQADNGVGAFHIDARRDANYEKLKSMRNSMFAVSQGFIVEF